MAEPHPDDGLRSGTRHSVITLTPSGRTGEFLRWWTGPQENWMPVSITHSVSPILIGGPERGHSHFNTTLRKRHLLQTEDVVGARVCNLDGGYAGMAFPAVPKH